MYTILLVEDSTFQRVAEERVLEGAGYKVLSTGNGDEVVTLALQHHPDLIILDMILPRMSGPEVLHALKVDASTSEIPVMVVSGLPQRNEAKLIREGAAAYYEKAAMESEDYSKSLLKAVQETLSKHSPPKN